MRKTKIICTLGPATNKDSVVRELMLAGMNVARFNFSHSTQADHKARFEQLVRIREELGLPVAALLDTKGPEIRLKKFEKGFVELSSGDMITFTTKDVIGNESVCSITYQDFPKDVRPGTKILVDDGLVELEVEKVKGGDVVCRAINGGRLADNKSVNVPDVHLSIPFMSEQDKSDIIFGAKLGFDFIAASFTRCANDIIEIRELLEKEGIHDIKIIAKIENMEGVNNADEILRFADGLMVARGDLGVEVPLEDIPAIQKHLITKAYRAGKIVITATQMLDSMAKNPRPTRAEATDVANAVYDNTSAIMLSGETANGMYPIEAVRTMSRIAERAEQDIDYIFRFDQFSQIKCADVTNAISHAACTTAHDLGAKAIITVTKSGYTVSEISKFRPKPMIIALTTSERVCRQMNLFWGVVPLMIDEKRTTDELFEHAVDIAHAKGYVDNGDLVVLTAGAPVGISGTTNLLKVHVVGKILVSGTGVNNRSVAAKLCVCKNAEEALQKFQSDEILVIPYTTNELFGLLKHAKGIVTETDGLNSHAAIAGLALDIPVVVGAKNATKILKDGVIVNLDAGHGVVCSSTSK